MFSIFIWFDRCSIFLFGLMDGLYFIMSGKTSVVVCKAISILAQEKTPKNAERRRWRSHLSTTLGGCQSSSDKHQLRAVLCLACNVRVCFGEIFTYATSVWYAPARMIGKLHHALGLARWNCGTQTPHAPQQGQDWPTIIDQNCNRRTNTYNHATRSAWQTHIYKTRSTTQKE